MILQNWWFTTLLGIKDPIRPPLRKHIRCDVLIVGAGAAGLSAAYALINKGLRVVIVERNICGGSSSGKSAGFLTPDSELELSQLIRRFGKAGASDLWKVATTGVEMMVDRVIRHRIDCDLQEQDSLFLGNGQGGWKDIREEMEARTKLGFSQTIYRKEEVRSVIGSDEYSGGVRYSGTFGINPLLYCQGMKQLLLDAGVEIYEATEVLSVGDHSVKTHLGSVAANDIIFCADKLSPSISHYADSIYHAQTFLSISEPVSDAAVGALFPSGRFQCWDTDLVYSYFRLTGNNRILLGGGSMWTTFAENDVNSSRVVDDVINAFKVKFPIVRDLEFIQYWPGRIDTTRDLLPTVTRGPKEQWIHFVLGCVGLPWATFCGDFAARHVYDDAACTDHHYYQYFRPNRHFFVPLWTEKFLGKKIVFSLNNGWAKYFQKDEEKKLDGSEQKGGSLLSDSALSGRTGD